MRGNLQLFAVAALASAGLWGQSVFPPAGAGGGGSVTSVGTTSPLSGGPITGTGSVACPTCGVTGSPLSQFAPTTSAQMASTVSDETGSGALVFAQSPTLVTPALGTPSAINLANATNFPTLNQSTTGNAATATALQTARTIDGTSFDGTANITLLNLGTPTTLVLTNATLLPAAAMPNAGVHTGDCLGTFPATTCTKTNGVSFATVATSGSAADLGGNLALARFNSGTSASSSTFWRGDATWAALPASSLTINSTTISGTCTNGVLYGDGSLLQCATSVTRSAPGTLTFATSVITPLVTASGALAFRPGSDSTTAMQFGAASGTAFVTFDPVNSRVAIGFATSPLFSLDVASSAVASEAGNFKRSTVSTTGSFGVVAFDLESTGTPAATFGPGNVFYSNSTTTARQPQGGIETGWVVATHASRAAFMKFNTVATGGVYTEQLRITDTGLLTFQGITSSFPALKRSSAKIQIRLADDSAAGTIEGKHNSSDGTAGATTTCTVLSITSITVKDGLVTGCS